MSIKPDLKKILDEAMQLEPATRAFIAETLIDSLDLERDYVVSEEWLEEVRRRCAEIDSGQSALLDGSMVINELRAKYTR